MNQLAAFDVEGQVRSIPRVIFRGTPSQIVNLPAYIKGVLAVVVVCGAELYAVQRWPVPWFVPVIAILAIVASVVVTYLRTAFNGIIIDTARITNRYGILNRRVRSIELFRIQDVTSVHPWWQRPFGLGTVLVLTSDSNNPYWRLSGMRHAEQLRDELNIAAIALRDAKGIQEVNMGRV